MDSAGETGLCQPVSTCSGSVQNGRCPGAAHIQCCIGSVDDGGIPGLDSQQSKRARTIMDVAREHRVGMHGCQVSITAALQASGILVFANPNVPESFEYPHDEIAGDSDSVGIFRQSPRVWGEVKDCMDPAKSASMFFTALKRINHWEMMTIGRAAQTVQGADDSSRFDEWLPFAVHICDSGFRRWMS